VSNANRFYTEAFNAPFGSLAKSVPLDQQFTRLEAAFKLVQEEFDALAGIGGITNLPGFPASFAGHGGKQLLVNAAESAIEFAPRGKLNYKSVSGTSYTLLKTDADAGTLIAFSNASAVTVTVPKNATQAIEVGSTLLVVQYGAGKVTLAPEDGTVTLRSAGNLLATRAQFAHVTLFKVATNEWLIGGDRGS